MADTPGESLAGYPITRDDNGDILAIRKPNGSIDWPAMGKIHAALALAEVVANPIKAAKDAAEAAARAVQGQRQPDAPPAVGPGVQPIPPGG